MPARNTASGQRTKQEHTQTCIATYISGRSGATGSAAIASTPCCPADSWLQVRVRQTCRRGLAGKAPLEASGTLSLPEMGLLERRVNCPQKKTQSHKGWRMSQWRRQAPAISKHRSYQRCHWQFYSQSRLPRTSMGSGTAITSDTRQCSLLVCWFAVLLPQSKSGADLAAATAHASYTAYTKRTSSPMAEAST